MSEEPRDQLANEADTVPGDETPFVLVDRVVDPYLVCFHEPRGFRAEQFRALRSKLLVMNPERAPRSLVVTSAIQGEGKSTTAINLALSFAELEDHRALLLDFDFRKPSIERLLGLNPEPGLTELLMGRLGLHEAIRSSGVESFDLIGPGSMPPNPSELLSSRRIDELVARLKEEYSLIVLDTPPVVPLTDAGVLSAKCDGTLLVVGLERAPRKLSKEAPQAARRIGRPSPRQLRRRCARGRSVQGSTLRLSARRLMVRRLTKKLNEAVRKLSYRATVDELRERGVEKVNVVGLDRIVALIEAAVHRTLKKHMLGIGGGLPDRSGIAEDTREEFLRLLQSQKTLAKEKEATEKRSDELREQVDDLRLMLHEAQKRLESRQKQAERESRARKAADDLSFTEALEELMQEHSASKELEEGVLGLVLTRLASERERITEARQKEYGGEIEKLERRIAKLTNSLGETEQQLSNALQDKSVEPGISSIYREVQGLDHGDAQFEKKSELMESIFAANLALQKGRDA